MTTKTVKLSSAFAISVVLLMTAISGQAVTCASAAPVSELATTDDAPWKISTIDAVRDVGLWTSLALDSKDNVHISYYDASHNDLKYATNASGQWVISRIDHSKSVGSYTSLALDSNDKAHISYYDETSGDLKYATNAAGSWATFTIDSQGRVGLFTSLALDSNDKVHISYVDESKGDIKYATDAGGSWITTIVDSVEFVSKWWSGTSLALDSNDMAHIGYVDAGNKDLKYATNAGGSWSTLTIEDGYAIILAASLALDSNDKVHIGYFDSNLFNLKYATNAGGSWTICEIGKTGHGVSLALDSNDKVHISYTGFSDSRLTYVTNSEGSWTTSTVDSTGDYGTFNSIELDSNDRVHISYYEEGNDDLRYATNAGPAIPGPPSKLVLYNGTVVTMEEDMPIADAIAVDGDCIVAVGTNEEILALVDDDTCVIDLCGRTILPGFIDPHSHALSINDIYASSLYPNIGPPYDIGHRWIYTWAYDDASSKRATVQDAIQKVLKGGWTSVTEMYADQRRLDDLIALDQEGDIRVRVTAYLPLSYQFERWGDWYKAYPAGQEFSSKLRIGGVKIFADDGYYGQTVYFSQEELSELVSKVHDEGYQVAIHAMGTSGIDLALNAYQQALQGESNEAYRHRVEHVSLLTDEQIGLMAEKDIIASFQMTWFTSNPWDIWDVKKYIGLDRVDLVGRWHDLLVAGVPSIGSTDYPWFYDTDGSAMTTIYKAVTRMGEPGRPVPQWELDQRITVEQALRLLTIGAAYGTFQEDVKGSIAVGKFADLVVLSENPLAVPPERLMDVSVLMTMVGGQVEYCAPGHEYLYGTVYGEALDAFDCGASSDACLLVQTEELYVTLEAVASSKESA
jgi:predicted amidohydrolase YtcJ